MPMLLTKTNKAVLALVALQAIFFIGWFSFEAMKLSDPKAETILVKTVPVDPRDYLSGNYLALRYEFNSLMRFNRLVPVIPGQEVFAVLKKQDHWFVPDYLSAQRPQVGKNQIVLKGRFLQNGAIEYGIEKFFINENVKEPNARSGAIEVALVVGNDLTPAIKMLMVNGVEFGQGGSNQVAIPGLAPQNPNPVITSPQSAEIAPQGAEIIPQNMVQLPVLDDIALWLETTSALSFDKTEMRDGAPISSWKPINKEGYLAPASAVGKPTLSANSINDLPAVKFNSQRGDSFSTANVVGGNVVIFVVLKTSNPGVGDESSQASQSSAVLWSDIVGAAQDIIPLAIGGGKAKFFTGSTESTLTSATRIDDGNAHIVRISRNIQTGLREIGIDGKISASDNNGGSTVLSANQQLLIGGNPLDRRYYDGYISEIIIYWRQLDAQKITLIEKYLSNKWKVALPN